MRRTPSAGAEAAVTGVARVTGAELDGVACVTDLELEAVLSAELQAISAKAAAPTIANEIRRRMK